MLLCEQKRGLSCAIGAEHLPVQSLACWFGEKLRADTRAEGIKSIDITSVIVMLLNLREAVFFPFSSRTEISIFCAEIKSRQ